MTSHQSLNVSPEYYGEQHVWLPVKESCKTSIVEGIPPVYTTYKALLTPTQSAWDNYHIVSLVDLTEQANHKQYKDI